MAGGASGRADSVLELSDIQSGVIRPRPTPYAASFIGLRIDDPCGLRLAGNRFGTHVGFGRLLEVGRPVGRWLLRLGVGGDGRLALAVAAAARAAARLLPRRTLAVGLAFVLAVPAPIDSIAILVRLARKPVWRL